VKNFNELFKMTGAGTNGVDTQHDNKTPIQMRYA